MKRYLMLLCLALFAVVAAVAQNDLKTVATVKLTKTEPITVKQLKDEVKLIETATGQALSIEDRKKVLDSMINERLALQAADRDKVVVSEAEVNQQINGMRSQLAQRTGKAPTDAEFATLIRQQAGMDLPAFRDQARRQLTVQKYLVSRKGTLLQALKEPTDAEIAKEYELHASDLTQDETVQFSAIVFPYKTDAEKAKARDSANKMAREINNNLESFDEKIQKGQSPDAGYMTSLGATLRKNAASRQQAGEEFLTEAFALSQGKLSKVIEIPNGQARGYYIIKITGKYPRKFLTLDDTHIEYGTSVRNLLREAIMQERQQEALVKAQQELIIELRKGDPFTIFDQNLNY